MLFLVENQASLTPPPLVENYTFFLTLPLTFWRSKRFWTIYFFDPKIWVKKRDQVDNLTIEYFESSRPRPSRNLENLELECGPAQPNLSQLVFGHSTVYFQPSRNIVLNAFFLVMPSSQLKQIILKKSINVVLWHTHRLWNTHKLNDNLPSEFQVIFNWIILARAYGVPAVVVRA